MEKIVNISGKEVKMRASALVPRMYRAKFGRDVIADVQALQKAYMEIEKDRAKGKKDKQFDALDLTIFENLAYVFAKSADPSIPETADEWLDSFDGVFSIYQVLPQILELWTEGMKQTSVPVKK